MLDEIKNIASGKKELRDFGFVIGGVLVAISMASWWLERESYRVWGSIGIVLVGAGLFAPFILKPLQKIWMAFAVVMGWMMTRLILAIVFYGMATPLGVLRRIFGKQFFEKGFNTAQASYWHIRARPMEEVSQYERQF